MKWRDACRDVAEAITKSRTVSDATSKVSDILGREVHWEQISREWRRWRMDGLVSGSAWEMLGGAEEEETYAPEPTPALVEIMQRPANISEPAPGPGPKIMVIPDVQAKPGVPLEHALWAGKYAAEKQPDVIVQLGDLWDFPSLSSYDSAARKAADQTCVSKDIDAGNQWLQMFDEALGGYKCRKVLLGGNHDCFLGDGRPGRYTADNPWNKGLLDRAQFLDRILGWERHKFLDVVEIHGVLFSHFFPQNRNGQVMQTRRGAPSAEEQIRRMGASCVAGHKQGLDVAIHTMHCGMRRGVIAGSYYLHDESYLTDGGNNHWRGLLMLYDIRDGGNFDLGEVSMRYLKRRFG